MSKQFGNKGTWDDFYTDHFADLTPELFYDEICNVYK